jgi:hypothetical protein
VAAGALCRSSAAASLLGGCLAAGFRSHDSRAARSGRLVNGFRNPTCVGLSDAGSRGLAAGFHDDGPTSSAFSRRLAAGLYDNSTSAAAPFSRRLAARFHSDPTSSAASNWRLAATTAPSGISTRAVCLCVRRLPG